MVQVGESSPRRFIRMLPYNIKRRKWMLQGKIFSLRHPGRYWVFTDGDWAGCSDNLDEIMWLGYNLANNSGEYPEVSIIDRRNNEYVKTWNEAD